MRRLGVLLALLLAMVIVLPGTALALSPSGSTECALADDDCDGSIDEDPVGDIDGDGNPDDDGDGAIDEDPIGDAADDPGENQVDCNEQTSQNVGGLVYVSAGSGGVEACADGTSAVPLDGRVIVDADEGYVAIDGDNSNTAPSNGYLRIDGSGIHCGDEQNQDSTADQSGNTAQDCG